jgi:hypothetical protein
MNDEKPIKRRVESLGLVSDCGKIKPVVQLDRARKYLKYASWLRTTKNLSYFQAHAAARKAYGISEEENF